MFLLGAVVGVVAVVHVQSLDTVAVAEKRQQKDAAKCWCVVVTYPHPLAARRSTNAVECLWMRL